MFQEDEDQIMLFRRLLQQVACLFALMYLLPSASADDSLRQRLEAWSAGYPAVVQGKSILNPERILEFYETQAYQLLWVEENNLNSNAVDLLQAIADVDADGLYPEDYHSTFFTNLGDPNNSGTSVAELEVLLTDAFLSLSQHILAGKVNPELLTSDWKARKRAFRAPELLARLHSGENLPDILDSLRPVHPRYRMLMQARQQLQQKAQVDWQLIDSFTALKPGAQDARVPQVRDKLQFWGDYNGELLADDTYDGELKIAVEKFQHRHGLEVDGVIGKATWQALNISPQQRLEDIRVNLERWRWLDEDTGKRFIVVNIADFDLRVYEDNKVIFQKPVIVGRNYRKTPVFSDAVKYLVLNPTWTVPYKLAVQDKLPDIKKDSAYLSRMGFSVFRQGTTEEIPAQTIDWESLSRGNFPYRLVQGPGPLNALGQVKFMFPNAYDVYLHDTPSKELFKKTERAFSSGCIRLADPIELAELLLSSQGMKKEDIQAILDSGKTTTIYLKSPLPIHIEYWTAWVDQVGRLNFRNDIYDRDKPVRVALQQALH